MKGNEEQGIVFVEGNSLDGEDDELYPLTDVEECSACGNWHAAGSTCPTLFDVGDLK